MDIFEIVKSLEFPLGSYIVVGSGHLIALGLKDFKDVDIVVTPEVFAECCRDPHWEQIPWTYPEKIGHIFLRQGVVELYEDVNSGSFNPTTDELLERAAIINGVAFVSLEDTLNFKKEYCKKNPKHLADINLIEQYLASKSL